MMYTRTTDPTDESKIEPTDDEPTDDCGRPLSPLSGNVRVTRDSDDRQPAPTGD